MITMYDEENQDIEKLIDNIDESNYLEEDEEDILDDESSKEQKTEDNISIYDIKYAKFNKDALLAEGKKPENKKSILTFIHKKTNIEYEGIFIGQDVKNPDKLLFSVNEKNKDNTKKYKIFRYNELKNLNYK